MSFCLSFRMRPHTHTQTKRAKLEKLIIECGNCASIKLIVHGKRRISNLQCTETNGTDCSFESCENENSRLACVCVCVRTYSSRASLHLRRKLHLHEQCKPIQYRNLHWRESNFVRLLFPVALQREREREKTELQVSSMRWQIK